MPLPKPGIDTKACTQPNRRQTDESSVTNLSSSRHIRRGVIQQILLHANVTITINIYVKTVSSDATVAMKALETMRATTVQPLALASTG